MASPERTVAEDYIAAVNAADIEALLALFSEKAQLRNPIGTFDGKEAIRAFYEGVVFRSKVHATVSKILSGDGHTMMEMYAETPFRPDYRAWAVDVFDLDAEGLVTKLWIYYVELAPTD